jgi:hypothetical protein
MATRTTASAGNEWGTARARGRRQKPRPSGGSPTARLTDAGRLSPLPLVGGGPP